jgi:hypothetical protein
MAPLSDFPQGAAPQIVNFTDRRPREMRPWSGNTIEGRPAPRKVAVLPLGERLPKW